MCKLNKSDMAEDVIFAVSYWRRRNGSKMFHVQSLELLIRSVGRRTKATDKKRNGFSNQITAELGRKDNGRLVHEIVNIGDVWGEEWRGWYVHKSDLASVSVIKPSSYAPPYPQEVFREMIALFEKVRSSLKEDYEGFNVEKVTAVPLKKQRLKSGIRRSGIYRIRNLTKSMTYIGQSRNIPGRIDGHNGLFEREDHHNDGLREDHKSGDVFEEPIEIIMYCKGRPTRNKFERFWGTYYIMIEGRTYNGDDYKTARFNGEEYPTLDEVREALIGIHERTGKVYSIPRALVDLCEPCGIDRRLKNKVKLAEDLVYGQYLP